MSLAINEEYISAAQLAHDLRSPLSAIQIGLQRSKESLPEETLALLDSAIDRINSLCEELLDDYRDQKANPVYEWVDVEAEIQRLIVDYRILNHGCSYLINLRGGGLLCPVSRNDFLRAMSNLISNSIEAMGANQEGASQLHIEVTTEFGMGLIRFKDTGPGIPDEHRNIIFQEGVTLGKQGGTGLGLFQVKSCFEKIGGKVEVKDSEFGAHIEIRFPLSRNL